MQLGVLCKDFVRLSIQRSHVRINHIILVGPSPEGLHAAVQECTEGGAAETMLRFSVKETKKVKRREGKEKKSCTNLKRVLYKMSSIEDLVAKQHGSFGITKKEKKERKKGPKTIYSSTAHLQPARLASLESLRTALSAAAAVQGRATPPGRARA